MRESVKALTFVDAVFVLMLMVSGSLGGIFSEAAYCLAFLLPFAIGFRYSEKLKRSREEERGVGEPPETLLFFNKKHITELLPIIAPTVAVVLSLSLLSSLVLSLLGVSAPPVEDVGLLKMLLIHALAPAVLEEMVFRYIPMKLLSPYSKRSCVVYSAFFFALIHCSFVQMPYAFVAGIIFMTVDLALGSVWPSIILHFINNATSVVCMKYCTGTVSTAVFASVLLVAVLISVIFIIKRKERYASYVRDTLKKDGTQFGGYAPFSLALLCCFLAILSI